MHYSTLVEPSRGVAGEAQRHTDLWPAAATGPGVKRINSHAEVPQESRKAQPALLQLAKAMHASVQLQAGSCYIVKSAAFEGDRLQLHVELRIIICRAGQAAAHGARLKLAEVQDARDEATS